MPRLLIALPDLAIRAIRDYEQLVYIYNSGEKAQTSEVEIGRTVGWQDMEQEAIAIANGS